jgi:hypothetical protein
VNKVGVQSQFAMLPRHFSQGAFLMQLRLFIKDARRRGLVQNTGLRELIQPLNGDRRRKANYTA